MPRIAFISFVVLVSCAAGIVAVRARENDLEKLFRQEQARFIDFKIGPNTKYIGSMKTRAPLKISFILVHNRLEASILRLENIASRVDGHIVEQGAKGTGIRDGKERLEDARAELRESKESLKTARADFEEVFLSNNPQDALDTIQEEINNNVIARLQNAHKIIVGLILDLKHGGS
jgi:hypothetical protein